MLKINGYKLIGSRLIIQISLKLSDIKLSYKYISHADEFEFFMSYS